MKKLTLTADADVVAQAHQLAEETGTSVSSMFARMIRLLAHQRKAAPRLGPLTRRASGIIALPTGKSERQILEDSLLEKYELRR